MKLKNLVNFELKQAAPREVFYPAWNIKIVLILINNISNFGVISHLITNTTVT